MGRDGWLVNTSRGPLVVESTLLCTPSTRVVLGGLGLDVFDPGAAAGG